MCKRKDVHLWRSTRKSLPEPIAAAGISRTTAPRWAGTAKKESGTLEVIKFYYDGAIRFEQHCYGEAATFVFGVWASGMDADGTLHWALPDKRKSYYDEEYLPKKLDRVDEAGNLYFDGGTFPGSWPMILPRTSAGATPNGRWFWESWPEKAAESARIVTD